jgi:hypothetical protein
MSIYDRLFRRAQNPVDEDYAIPSSSTAKEFGKVNVRKTATEYHVQLTILMEPQGREAEGWQTGVALDASASMKGWFGRDLKGKIPPEIIKDYEGKGWVETRREDGRVVKCFKGEAHRDAIGRGYLQRTPNIVEPLARNFISYLADQLDADGGTTVIYWACGDGSAIEVAGDFTGDECRALTMEGPKTVAFGSGTRLSPAVSYFIDRFVDASRGMYVFITDGKLDDLDDVKKLTVQLAQNIEAGKCNPVKCVLVGVGDQIDEGQMEQLDDLDTGTDVDIWDHKIAAEMRDLLEIFAEVVSENLIVAPLGVIYDSEGNIVKKLTDGVPARMSFSMPARSDWFELEVQGRRIRQQVVK